MEAKEYSSAQAQLIQRRRRLQGAVSDFEENSHFVSLLQEVDSALERIDNRSYGLCEACHDPVEEELIQSDPLIRFCLDHLTLSQQRELERDLNLASRIQGALLPKNDLVLDGWEISYHYEPAGLVSGDYCDLIDLNNRDRGLLFIIGDVSGKGVAASMLMTQMHAMFHSLIDFGLPVNRLVERANRLLCESTLSTHYSTLVYGRAVKTGEIEVCNAGHCAPLLVQSGKVISLKATGLPIGLFCNEQYSVTNVEMNSGDSLFLYTDGLSEARKGEKEYGDERVIRLASELNLLPPKQLIEAFLHNVEDFLSGTSKTDDLTMMVIRRVK